MLAAAGAPPAFDSHPASPSQAAPLTSCESRKPGDAGQDTLYLKPGSTWPPLPNPRLGLWAGDTQPSNSGQVGRGHPAAPLPLFHLPLAAPGQAGLLPQPPPRGPWPGCGQFRTPSPPATRLPSSTRPGSTCPPCGSPRPADSLLSSHAIPAERSPCTSAYHAQYKNSPTWPEGPPPTIWALCPTWVNAPPCTELASFQFL